MAYEGKGPELPPQFYRLGKTEREAWSNVFYSSYLVLVIVNCMCQLDWPVGAQTMLFLGVSVRLHPDEIGIWIDELSKVDGPPQSGWAPSHLVRAQIEQKAEEGGINLLPAWLSWDISSYLLWSLDGFKTGFSILRPVDSDSELCHWLSRASSL